LGRQRDGGRQNKRLTARWTLLQPSRLAAKRLPQISAKYAARCAASRTEIESAAA